MAYTDEWLPDGSVNTFCRRQKYCSGQREQMPNKELMLTAPNNLLTHQFLHT